MDIHKAAAIIIKDRKLLVTRSKNKDFFVSPGGKIENNETPKQAVIRELKEELSIHVQESDLEYFGTFFATAAGDEAKKINMEVFTVNYFAGEISVDNEIEEILWLNTLIPSKVRVGSIFEHDVIPRLKSKGLID